jgi:hypothetical protein
MLRKSEGSGVSRHIDTQGFIAFPGRWPRTTTSAMVGRNPLRESALLLAQEALLREFHSPKEAIGIPLDEGTKRKRLQRPGKKPVAANKRANGSNAESVASHSHGAAQIGESRTQALILLANARPLCAASNIGTPRAKIGGSARISARRVVAGAMHRLKLPRFEEAPYLVVDLVSRQGVALWTQGNNRTDAGVALMIALDSLSPYALG